MTNIICLTLGDFGVNTYLFAYKKGICIVDPGDKADIIEKSVISLQEKSNLPKDCEISIFLTHGHLDHVGAIEKLKSFFTNAKIFINKKDEKFASDDYDSSANDENLDLTVDSSTTESSSDAFLV